jgi:uncharacterized FlgJ-related protein
MMKTTPATLSDERRILLKKKYYGNGLTKKEQMRLDEIEQLIKREGK